MRYSRSFLLVLLGLAWFVLPWPAAGSGDPVAVLVVSQKAMEGRAKAVIDRVVHLRSEAGYSADRLPILGLHFENADERNYCEQNLKIHAANLLFVGVVTLGPDGLPAKVLFRVDNANDPQTDAQVAFLKARGQIRMGGGVSVGIHHPIEQQPTPAPETRQITNSTDGSAMVLVSGGAFSMGSNLSDSEKPVSSVSLSSYYIGKCPVTNAQYRKFVDATHHQTPGDWESAASQWGDRAPVVNVSWSDAMAYCQWAGVRLPTEAEWEKAARGTDQRKYPWGNDFDPGRCRNSVDTAASGPTAVGSYPTGASPYGCLDMAGNVWQWCSSKYEPYPYTAGDGREDLGGGNDIHRVIRGGSWYNVVGDVFRASHRVASRPVDYANNIGFRIARSL